MARNHSSLVTALLACFVALGAARCAEPTSPQVGGEKVLIGDRPNGGRAPPVHRIPLRDEQGQEIFPDDEPALPFSTRQTCASQCHDYEKIRHGWHFNARQEEVDSGRAGHPWILVDAATGTQLPLSYRRWPGCYRPEDAGLSRWEFVKRFGRQMPGGGAGQWGEPESPDEVARILVSGPLEINCLACHDADPGHDQSQYAAAVSQENFRWAAAATSAFALVSGSAKEMPDTYDFMMPDTLTNPRLRPPKIVYRQEAFDSENRVLFDIVRRAPRQRCYFCHSTAREESAGAARWMEDEDVHLAAGLICVDCHRNGVDHEITRGDEAPGAGGLQAPPSLSCRGCHLGVEENGRLAGGRLGAPEPRHAGLPPLHLERLACTACHSGPWPGPAARRVKTSLAHGLGVHRQPSNDFPPNIFSPVFARNAEGRIAPHYLLWPSFWGVRSEEGIQPIPLDEVRRALPPLDRRTTNQDGWPELTEEFIAQCLKKLSSSKFGGSSRPGMASRNRKALGRRLIRPPLQAHHVQNLEVRKLESNEGTGGEATEGRPVYVSGGQVFELDEKQNVIHQPTEAAAPYRWPIAHDVRPAAQALGAGGCTDCHARGASFFFSQVPVDSPVALARASIEMIEFEKVDRDTTRALSAAWPLRPWLKAATLASSLIVLALLAAYGCRALVRTALLFGDRG